MKKQFLGWLAISAAIMFLLPWFVVTFAQGDFGMAACILLFLVINPLYSIIVGAFAGKNIKEMWALPVISAIMFLPGAWLFLDMGEGAFVIYAGAYLVIGVITMLISKFISMRPRR